MGNGTMGSRGLVVGGSALVMAIDQVMAKARKIAASMLEVAEDDIGIDQGQFQVKGVPGRALTLKQIAEKPTAARNCRTTSSPGLDATDFFRPPDTTFPFGTHIVVVEIDRETGTPTVLRYVSVDDCGNVISPLLVDGQVHGGLAQGIGQALCEEVVYDEQGQLMTGSLMDYAMPKAWQLAGLPTSTAPSRPPRATRSAPRASARRRRSARPPHRQRRHRRARALRRHPPRHAAAPGEDLAGHQQAIAPPDVAEGIRSSLQESRLLPVPKSPPAKASISWSIGNAS